MYRYLNSNDCNTYVIISARERKTIEVVSKSAVRRFVQLRRKRETPTWPTVFRSRNRPASDVVARSRGFHPRTSRSREEPKSLSATSTRGVYYPAVRPGTRLLLNSLASSCAETRCTVNVIRHGNLEMIKRYGRSSNRPRAEVSGSQTVRPRTDRQLDSV